jgi:hypothetical protein
MKAIFVNSLLILPLLISLSCKDKISDPGTKYTVKGKVLYNNSAIINAQVSLDKAANYSTNTDEEGNFVINDVPEGTHQLTISKNLNDGNFTEISQTVAVTGDVDLSDLKLPKAVYLYPLQNVTSSSVDISWSPTDAIDFREYKIYRHTSPGLDETTGTLIYVATSINDTSFVDTGLFEWTTYYYRVYVMNEFGRLGGSNIASSKTLYKNLIKNGDFELFNSSNRPTDWLTTTDVFFVSNQNVQNGNYALRGERNSYLVELGPPASLRQFIPYTSIVAGKQYTFSFYYKVDSLAGNSTLQVALGTNVQSAYSIFYYNIDGNTLEGWQNFTFTFTAPQLTEDLVLSCYVQTNVPYNGEPWLMWLDNFELKRTD